MNAVPLIRASSAVTAVSPLPQATGHAHAERSTAESSAQTAVRRDLSLIKAFNALTDETSR